MAKKPSRSGKPQPGGRVTPKGVRPAEASGPARPTARQVPPSGPVARKLDPSHGRGAAAVHAPTRAGHHRGQR